MFSPCLRWFASTVMQNNGIFGSHRPKGSALSYRGPTVHSDLTVLLHALQNDKEAALPSPISWSIKSFPVICWSCNSSLQRMIETWAVKMKYELCILSMSVCILLSSVSVWLAVECSWFSTRLHAWTTSCSVCVGLLCCCHRTLLSTV